MPVEMRLAFLPVVVVLRELDVLVLLEADELERSGADRVRPHLLRRHMAGIDRRVARGQQRDESRLAALQMERRLMVAVRGDFLEVLVPGLARVLAQLGLAVAEHEVPGAFDIRRGERLAVMPLDALAQLEGEFRAVIVPAPALRQVRNDSVEAILRHVLLVHDEVVVNAHVRRNRRVGRLLVDRAARRRAAMVEFQDAAVLLRERRPGIAREHCHAEAECRGACQITHACIPPG